MTGPTGTSPSMPQGMTIVQADFDNPTHQEAVVRLIDAYAQDPIGLGHELPENVRAALIPGLRRHPATLIFLALSGEDPVGIAVCFLGFSTFAARPLLNIHDLAVLPAYRRQGVGRQLLSQVERKARALGCCKLTLEVKEDNVRAQHLYEKVGFDGIHVGGTGSAMWFLEKKL